MTLRNYLLAVVSLLVVFMACPLVLAESPAVADQTAAEAKAKKQRRKEKKQAAAQAEANKDAEQLYIRVLRDKDDNPLTMETAIVTYHAAGKKNRGVQVDLVGAVHIGDVAYYQELNKAFEGYDVLLYELVAPEGTKIPKGGRKSSGSLIGSLQGGMKSVLELEHQLEQIDYTKKNFVHADMSPEEFAQSMKDRGESFLQMIFKAMGQSAAMQGSNKRQVSDVELLSALFAKDRALRLKRIAANQFENLEGTTTIFDGEDGSTILTERNKKCMTVLQREIDKGHKKIGIFYGAAHLPDMDARLLDEFGMRRGDTRWVVAWKLGEGEPVVPAASNESTPEADKVEPKTKKQRKAERRKRREEAAQHEAKLQSS